MNRAEKRRQQRAARKNQRLTCGDGKPTVKAPDIQQAINLALQHHNSGRLREAESTYQQVLQTDPNQPIALFRLGMIAYQAGNYDIAVDLITKAIVIKPEFVEAHSNLGLALRDLGKLDEAVSSFHKALEIKPDFVAAHYNLGLVFQNLGKLDDAVASYHNALAIKPDYVDAHSNIGLAFQGLGKLDDAATSFRNALAINPEYAEAYSNLGLVLQDMGKLDEAMASFHKALSIKPDFAEAHGNLGLALQDLGKLDEAEASYRKVLAINPNFAAAHSNLGNVLKELGKLDEAVASYHKALAITPDYAEAHYNLGNALKDLGKLDEAVASYHKALAIKSDYAEAHSNLGNTLKELNKLEEAVTSYRKALTIKPDHAETHNSLGLTLYDQGNFDGAVKQLDIALSYQPENAGWRVRKALLLPIIPYSQEDTESRRKVLGEVVQTLQKQNLCVEDPPTEVGTTNFYLAYHNQDNRTLLEDIAKLHIAAYPKLTFEAKHCRSRRDGQSDRLRIGFLSSYFRRHTIGKLSRGIIENFSRDYFEVIVFRLPGKKDDISELIDQAADKVVPLRKKLDMDWRIIAEEELDILFYYDIGMDPYSYFLSFSRLAPVQAVCWGHPDTTGIPNIDYFISSDLLEYPGTCGQYTEQLALLSALPTYYYRPDIPEETFGRADFGLADKGALYVCPQTLFKLHPDFDEIIGDLLHRDLGGRVVLIDDGKGGHWKNLIIERIGRSCPEIVDRVIFLPKMPHEKFLGLLILADAVLDVPTFSGGNSSLEAFAMSATVVTWPGDFMRNRVTAGCYKQMGLCDLIASDADTYVSLALKLAHDEDFRSRMQADINSNSHKLFERIAVVREMEAFFIQVYISSQKGEVLTRPWTH